MRITQSLLVLCAVAAFAFSPQANSQHLTISRVNVATGSNLETGDFLLQFSDGSAQLIPFVTSESASGLVRLDSPGSHWLPIIRIGAGYNYIPGGGGGGPGGPGHIQSEKEFPPGVERNPILGWAARACLIGIGASMGIAEFTCRNSGGVQSFAYSLCSFGNATVNCVQPPPPPPPPPAPGNGGGNPGGNGGGGGGITSFPGFSSPSGSGTIEVHPIQPDENED
jgi:hypothetical protein